jgi:O-antigen ligase
MTLPHADIDDQNPVDVGTNERSGAEQSKIAHSPSARRRRRRRNAAKPATALLRMNIPLPRSATVIGIALVIAAMALGGGGSTAPKTETILQIAIAALLLIASGIPHRLAGLGPVPGVAWLATTPLILITLAQLAPLPPSIWRNLPGRDVERSALDLVGAGSSWMPLTIAPTATVASLLAILCIAAIMLFITRLDLAGRAAVALAIMLMAVASIALGTLQLAHFGGANWALYNDFTTGWLVGFQANRNAQADILQIGMLAAATASLVRLDGPESSRVQLPAVFACLAVLAIGVLMTGSRAGIALLPTTFFFALAIVWPRLKRKVKFLKLWIGGITLAIAVAGFGLSRIAVIQAVISRFGADTEGRWDFWLDTVYALRKAWPAGTGVGTFSYAYPAVERLELVDPLLLTRAHNDWLEWTLEAGLAGWIGIGLTMIALAWSTRLAWRQASATRHDPIQRGQILFGIAVLINEALHALVDYPTRSMSLAALIAVAVAFLTPVSQKNTRRKTGAAT